LVLSLFALYFYTVERHALSLEDQDRIIEMAWEDRTPFEAIAGQFQALEETGSGKGDQAPWASPQRGDPLQVLSPASH
jgi:hypothetical protein